jgi:hypothetical protein
VLSFSKKKIRFGNKGCKPAGSPCAWVVKTTHSWCGASCDSAGQSPPKCFSAAAPAQPLSCPGRRPQPPAPRRRPQSPAPPLSTRRKDDKNSATPGLYLTSEVRVGIGMRKNDITITQKWANGINTTDANGNPNYSLKCARVAAHMTQEWGTMQDWLVDAYNKAPK